MVDLYILVGPRVSELAPLCKVEGEWRRKPYHWCQGGAVSAVPLRWDEISRKFDFFHILGSVALKNRGWNVRGTEMDHFTAPAASDGSSQRPLFYWDLGKKVGCEEAENPEEEKIYEWGQNFLPFLITDNLWGSPWVTSVKCSLWPHGWLGGLGTPALAPHRPSQCVVTLSPLVWPMGNLWLSWSLLPNPAPDLIFKIFPNQLYFADFL